MANGRPWDLDRNSGGFRLIVPQEGGAPDAADFASGNADGLYRIRDEPGSWKDLGRPEAYLAAHRDLIRGETVERAETHGREGRNARPRGQKCTTASPELPS